MNEGELFNRLPELLFENFRHQLLLGVVPAETVEAVLEPLLADFFEIMLALSPDIQADLENILRIYPEVAEKHGLNMKPPLENSLSALTEYLLDRERRLPLEEDAGAAILDLAAEDQEELEKPPRKVLFEGQGFYQTDLGNSVFIEFNYAEGDDFLTFSRRPVDIGVEIYIKGALTLRLMQGESEKRLDIRKFLKVVGEGALKQGSITIVEKRLQDAPRDA